MFVKLKSSLSCPQRVRARARSFIVYTLRKARRNETHNCDTSKEYVLVVVFNNFISF